MSRIRRLVSTCALAAAIGVTGAAARAENGAEAARAAQEKHGGRVLSLDERIDAYRIKLLQDSGRVKVIEVPRFAPSDSEEPRGKPGEKSGKKNKKRRKRRPERGY